MATDEILITGNCDIFNVMVAMWLPRLSPVPTRFVSPAPSPMNLVAIITPVADIELLMVPPESRQICAIWLEAEPVDTMSRAACGARVEIPMVLAARSPNRTPPILSSLDAVGAEVSWS